MNFDQLLRETPNGSTDITAFRPIEGWMTDEAADMSVRLGHLQKALHATVGVLELGIFKGKYLSLLANLFQDQGIPVVGVDAFIIRIGEMVSEETQGLVRQQISKTVTDFAPRAGQPTLVTSWTRDVDPASLRSFSPGGYSFISVDAGHEAPDVEHDLGLAEAVMSDRAVVAADDVFNPKVPGVVEGLCRYFLRNPETRLAPFACCGNKLFLCNASSHHLYLAYVKWMLANIKGSSYISKSADLNSQNERGGFRPALFGHEIVTFDWN